MNTKMLIDGKLADGAGQLDVVTPATGTVMATVKVATWLVTEPTGVEATTQ